jgi:hypothetical protein
MAFINPTVGGTYPQQSSGVVSFREGTINMKGGFIGGTFSGTSASFSSSVTATSYITSSDYRLKNTITPMSSMLDKITLLKPCTYNLNADDTETIGFIAHEVAEIIPLAVIGEKDGEQMQGIDYSKIVAVLVKGIQEQQAQIEELRKIVATK